MIKLHKSEKNVKSYLLRFCLGPASIIDGIVETTTLGFCSVGAKLFVAKILAKSRV